MSLQALSIWFFILLFILGIVLIRLLQTNKGLTDLYKLVEQLAKATGAMSIEYGKRIEKLEKKNKKKEN